MTIENLISRMDYVGNGLASVYPYTFKIFGDTDLEVTVRSPAGIESTLTLNTDYSVSGAGGGEEGGAVTLIGSGSWLTAGKLTTSYALAIRRVRPLTQETDISNQGGAYLPVLHENAFDHHVMICQQLQEEFSRSIMIPVTETGPMELPAKEDRASKYAYFDSDGDIVGVASSISETPVSGFMETLLDDADAATARATLNAVSQEELDVVASVASDAADSALAAAPLAGDVRLTARPSAPAGWFLCDGSALSRATYSGLFSAIGIAYGAGDGSTTFNIPDMRGRVAVGAGAATALTSTRSRGDVSGAETHQHPIPHGHTIPIGRQGGFLQTPATPAAWGGTEDINLPVANYQAVSGTIQTVSWMKTRGLDTANSLSGSSMPPFSCLNYIIKS